MGERIQRVLRRVRGMGPFEEYCKWASGMRPMWEEDGGWSEEPEVEEQVGDSLCCLREEASEDGESGR